MISYIVEICSGIANGQISSIITRVICPPHNSGRIFIVSHFYSDKDFRDSMCLNHQVDLVVSQILFTGHSLM